MAATNHEKQKKGPLMSLYKAATASPRHRSQLPESNPPPPDSHHQVDIKSYISRGWLFRKSKVVRGATTYQGNDHGQVAVLENNIIIEPEKAKADGGGGGGRHGGDGGGGGGGGEKVGHVMIEGRKSVSHVETNLGSVVAFLQVKVLVSDMPNYMQVHAFRCARRTYDSLEKFSARHMAYNIKKEFDKVHGPAWHCIVGSSFGSFVTHSTGCFLYFSMDQKLYILLFKTKIQKAPH